MAREAVTVRSAKEHHVFGSKSKTERVQDAASDYAGSAAEAAADLKDKVADAAPEILGKASVTADRAAELAA
ncbi:hypothetical protein, partial [Nostocoides japonicum]|uniref:hypothetical protein n=1 Tax=Nostocoides japonicum TaxID=99481 RepID=UPI00138EDFE1